jgi:hypothetical protein
VNAIIQRCADAIDQQELPGHSVPTADKLLPFFHEYGEQVRQGFAKRFGRAVRQLLSKQDDPVIQ